MWPRDEAMMVVAKDQGFVPCTSCPVPALPPEVAATSITTGGQSDLNPWESFLAGN